MNRAGCCVQSLAGFASQVVGHVEGLVPTMDGSLLGEVDALQTEFLAGFTVELQKQTERVIDLKELVVKVT
jgi:hypothetical protein